MPHLDYMGSTDAQKRDWLNNFDQKIQSSPSAFQLSTADSNTIHVSVAAFLAAYAIATAPETRTKATVQQKDETRNNAVAICRQYAQQIKLNAGVSDADKINAGIPIVNETRNPRNVPESSPILAVLGATPGSHTVRYVDSATPDSTAKPLGADNIQIFVAIMDEATVNEDDARFFGAYTRNPVVAGYTPQDDGKMATYFARWAGKDGQVGPWSLPVSMRVAA